MTRKTFFAVTTVFIFIFLSSCSKDEEKGNAFKYIDLEYYEQFSATGSDINFMLRTIETFPCDNFSLEVHVTPSANHVEIQVAEIDVPDVCLTALGPARQLLEMGTPEELPHSFTLWVNDKRHEFQVKIENDLITIEQGQPFENHLFFSYDSLMRIPENTFWGYAVFEQNELSDTILSEILAAFKRAGAEIFLLPDGNYHYFTVKENEIIFDNIKQDTQTFYFQFEESMDVLIDIYENITEQYEQPDIQLRLFNTQGERFVM